ncbi:hypothetical protein Tco_0720216 [Tanacetum coccineum]
MKKSFRGAPRHLLPAMLFVASTNPNAGQEHPDVPQSQPSSSTILVPSTSLPPEQSPPLYLLLSLALHLPPKNPRNRPLSQANQADTIGDAIVKLVKKVKEAGSILNRKNWSFSTLIRGERQPLGAIKGAAINLSLGLPLNSQSPIDKRKEVITEEKTKGKKGCH